MGAADSGAAPPVVAHCAARTGGGRSSRTAEPRAAPPPSPGGPPDTPSGAGSAISGARSAMAAESAPDAGRPDWQQKLLQRRSVSARPVAGSAGQPPPPHRPLSVPPGRSGAGSGSGRPAQSQSRAGAAGERAAARGEAAGGGSWTRGAGQVRAAATRLTTERAESVDDTAPAQQQQRRGQQFRADTSDAWRNRELRMGVSVAPSVTSGARRGYPRSYRIGRPGQEKTAMDDSDSSSEELRYGPGIVSRLKDRYISMALRETTRRPSLRRVSSLEHIANSTAETKPAVGGDVRGGSNGAAVPGRGRLDSMKRAKSVGDLTSARPSGGGAAPSDGSRPLQRRDRKEQPQPPPPDALPEKIVIVEESDRRPAGHPVLVPPQGRPAPMAETPAAGEDALPAPDTVKTVKRLFEPSPRRPGVTRPAATGSRAVIDRTGRTRRTSPSSRPPPLTSRPAVKPPPPALKTSSREKLTSSTARGPPLKAVPVSTAASSAPRPRSAVSPPRAQNHGSRRPVSEDAPDLSAPVPRRPEKLTWSQLRQGSSVSEGTQTPSPPTTPPVTSPVTQPTSPVRPTAALKKPLSRESSAEPASPTSSPVRRQAGIKVGIIKPNRKVENRTDEFNQRKNRLNHVRNSVVEQEMAVIGTEYLKRRDHLEEPAPHPKPSPALNGAREAQDSAPPPALPPRKAVLEPTKTLPLSIDTAPPRPAPFQGVYLKPVPKEPARHEEPAPSPPLKPKTRQPEPEPTREPVRGPVREPERELKHVPAAVTRSQPAGVTRPQPAAPAPEVVNRGPPPAKPKWHQAADTSMTFNFTKRQEVPDYVEDDGLILRRKLPKVSPRSRGEDVLTWWFQTRCF